MARERDGFAQDGRVGGEAPLPETVAEDNHGEAFFAGQEAAAKVHANLRYIEKVGGGRLPPDALRLARAANRRRQKLIVGRDAGKRTGLVAQVSVERPGKIITAAIAIVRRVERHQSAGIADRCGPEHEAADHGKDGRVGSDAQSDGEDDSEHKSGCSGETPEAVGQILPQCHDAASIAYYGEAGVMVPGQRSYSSSQGLVSVHRFSPGGRAEGQPG